MPRKSRKYAPGALHHIIARGIERNKIFNDDFDRDEKASYRFAPWGRARRKNTI
jgi:REP element-mobilizing transposase RayT